MWRRKLFHLCGVVIPILYVGADVSRATVLWIGGALTAVLLALDFARARSPALQVRFERWFKPILDPKDRKGLNGSTLYFGGCFLAVLLFDRIPASVGITALVVGDPMAALIGSSVRSPRWGRVSLAGTLACFFFAGGASLFLVTWPRALAAGASAALLEAVSGSKLDNLVIPLGVAGLQALL